MKKQIIIFIAILILLVSNVYAGTIATIGMTGLSFVNPTAATAVRTVLCVTSPLGLVTCAEQFIEGKVIGQIYGEALQKIAKISPEAAKAISRYNQVKDYIDTGTVILKDLKINEKGEVIEGILSVGNTEEDITQLINEDLIFSEIIIQNADITFNEKLNYHSITIHNNGKLKIIEHEDRIEGAIIDEKIYNNIKEGGIFKLDKDGILFEADFLTNEKGSIYKFDKIKKENLEGKKESYYISEGTDEIYAPPNSHITYKEGKIRIEVPDGGIINKFPKLIKGEEGNIIEYSGKNLILPGGYVLNNGVITSIKGIPQIKIGDYAIINNIKINPIENNVELRFGKKSFSALAKEKGNFVRFSDKVQVGGRGFSIDFSPMSLSNQKNKETIFIKLHERGYYKAGDSPQVGSEDEDAIKKIQKIVGATPDGKYGTETMAKVKSWQEDIYKKTKICLGKETSSGCIGDGLFGSKSASFVMGNNFDNPVSISPKNGVAEFYTNKEGFNANLRGALNFKVGNKQMNFDGKNIYRDITYSFFNAEMSIPTKLSFYDSNGDKIGNTIETQGIDTFFSEDLTSTKLLKIAGKRGITSEQVQCAGTVCAVFNQQAPEGRRYGEGFLLDPTLSGAAGVEGTAWEMSENMIKKGGKRIFSFEDYLSNEEQQKLNELEKEFSIKYNNKLNEIKDLYKTNKEEYEIKKTQMIKDLSEELRIKQNEILGKDVIQSNTVLDSGDIVSLYYQDSNYLAEALVNGKDNQKNTHVGVVTTFKEKNVDVSDAKDIFSHIKNNLGIKNDESLYVNEYYAQIKGSDSFEKIVLKDDKFYHTDGFEVESAQRILIRRPQIAHMFNQGGNPFGVNDLDKAIDNSKLSLYGITRPKEELKQKIIEAKSNVDKFSIYENIIDCKDPPCSILKPLERAKYSGLDEDIIDYLDTKLDYSGIPTNQRDEFQAAIVSAIDIEGKGFLKKAFHKAEAIFANLAGIEDISLGPSQLKQSTLNQAGKLLGKDVSKIDLSTTEGSAKGTAIVMEAIFKKYIPKSRESLTDEDIEIIGAAWNSGIDSEYAKALRRSTYVVYTTPPKIPTVKPSAEGDPTKKTVVNIKGTVEHYYRTWQGYDTTAYFNAYPQRYKDTFKNYCC